MYIMSKNAVLPDYIVLSDRDKIHDVRRNKTFNQVIVRYEKRFKAADRDNDKLMNKDEFADFLHPRKLVCTSCKV